MLVKFVVHIRKRTVQTADFPLENKMEISPWKTEMTLSLYISGWFMNY